MVDVIYAPPDMPMPQQRHVVVVVHRDGTPPMEKGYFYDSAEEDSGGSGPFDWRLDEAIARARAFAAQRNLTKVIVRARQSADTKERRA